MHFPNGGKAALGPGMVATLTDGSFYQLENTLCGFGGVADFRQAHQQWVEEALQGELAMRDARWSEAPAVGSLAFVEKVKGELGIKAVHREVERGSRRMHCGNRVKLTGPI